MGTLVALVGNRGSGKTVFATAIAQMVHQLYPKVIIASNCNITFADGSKVVYQAEILKWLAVKIASKDMDFAEIIIDEASISGMEARGYHGKESAISSYLIALSRKAKVDIWVITQLLSMIEKRAQWLSDFYILARANFKQNQKGTIPSYFSYRIYDESLVYRRTLYINGLAAKKFIFPYFDTNEIPGFEELADQLIKQFKITKEDIDTYKLGKLEYKGLTL